MLELNSKTLRILITAKSSQNQGDQIYFIAFFPVYFSELCFVFVVLAVAFLAKRLYVSTGAKPQVLAILFMMAVKMRRASTFNAAVSVSLPCLAPDCSPMSRLKIYKIFTLSLCHN